MRSFWEEFRDVVAVVGGDALETTNGDGLSVDATAAARRLAGTIARAAEDAWKDVRFAIEEVRFGESSLSDEADVLRHVRVGRAGPLAIHHFMVVLRIRDVGGRARSWCGS
jgi:hypothetical protein